MSTVRVGSRVEWTWWCGTHEDGDDCDCQGVGTGTVVEVNTDEDSSLIAVVKVDDADTYMNVFDENVLQVIS